MVKETENLQSTMSSPCKSLGRWYFKAWEKQVPPNLAVLSLLSHSDTHYASLVITVKWGKYTFKTRHISFREREHRTKGICAVVTRSSFKAQWVFYINNISFYVAPVILYSVLYVSNISCLPHQPSGWQPSYTHQTWHWKLPIYIHPPSPASSWLSFSCSAEIWTTFLSSFSFYGSITEAHSNASYPTYLPLIISITIIHPTLFLHSAQIP